LSGLVRYLAMCILIYNTSYYCF